MPERVRHLRSHWLVGETMQEFIRQNSELINIPAGFVDTGELHCNGLFKLHIRGHFQIGLTDPRRFLDIAAFNPLQKGGVAELLDVLMLCVLLNQAAKSEKGFECAPH